MKRSPLTGETAACVGRLKGSPLQVGEGLPPSVSSSSPSCDHFVIECVPSSTHQTASSAPMNMPCVRASKTPRPKLRRKLPCRSNTITG